MKRASALVFACLLARMCVGQSPNQCPNTKDLSNAKEMNEYWLEGVMGPKQIRMYLERGDDAVVGLYYDVADWKPILFERHVGRSRHG